MLMATRFGFLHLQSAQEPDVFNHPLIAGIGSHNVNCAVANLEREHPVAFYEIGGERANGFRRHVEFG